MKRSGICQFVRVAYSAFALALTLLFFSAGYSAVRSGVPGSHVFELFPRFLHSDTIVHKDSTASGGGEEDLEDDIFTFTSSQFACWDNHRIDIYNLDMTRMMDTFNFVLDDYSQDFHYPLQCTADLVSTFGFRNLFGNRFHYGVDLDLETGDTVLAAMDGVIRVLRYDPGYGNFIVLSHSGGLETLYGHLSKSLVTDGQFVFGGQPIGLGGSTGRSTGSHLHFEFRFMGEQFDPCRVVDFSSGSLHSPEFTIDRTWFDHLIELRKAKYYVIRRGDTLGRIASRNGTTIARLCKLNSISSRTILRVGRKLRVA